MEEPIGIVDSSAFDAGRASRAGMAALALLYSGALFVGALILFAIEPMFTKMILPLMGGTPAVWNTALVFFQAMLLVGYLYAHLLSRLGRVYWQVLIHGSVLVVGFLFLPVRVAWPGTSLGSVHPVAWLTGVLAVSIGLPFFAVSATAPLLQRWFSHSAHAQARDPYFLYAASNVGGLAVLLAYPVVIEPWLGLRVQSLAWTGGYGLLVLLILCCAISLRGRNRASGEGVDPAPAADEALLSDKVTWERRLHWVALSFVPSAMLLAVTLHISTDVASVPFLWVAPLALYMLSFVLVFARRPILKHKWVLAAQIPAYAMVAIYFREKEFLLVLAMHLAVLFVTAMVCHGELVRHRPAARHLTEFYLWMSVGGLLGGVFCALLAPILFNSVLEYPLILVAACLLRPQSSGRLVKYVLGALKRVVGIGKHVLPVFEYALDVLLPVAFVALYFFLQPQVDARLDGIAAPLVIYAVVLVVLFAFRSRPVRFSLAFAPLLFGAVRPNQFGHELYRQRSFFAVYRVVGSESGGRHELYHGNISHGDENMDAEGVGVPTSYYNQEGPLGQVFTAMREERPLKHVACVGLGTGTTACYQVPGQTMTFFEVDPVIERIARDPKLFRYLDIHGQGVKVVIGDGRQSLSRCPDGSFDLIVLDAFSSDAIPVHMMTREALAMYMRKLAPAGIVMFHISNRYLNLEPVVANLAADAGLDALVEDYSPTQEERMAGASSSTWVAVARQEADLAVLAKDERWWPPQGSATVGVWTDDYSNIFRTLIWDQLLPQELETWVSNLLPSRK
jgi:spermidine synthase